MLLACICEGEGGHDAVNAHSYSHDSCDPLEGSPTADMRVSHWGGQMTNPLTLPSLRGDGGLPTQTDGSA